MSNKKKWNLLMLGQSANEEFKKKRREKRMAYSCDLFLIYFVLNNFCDIF